MTTNLFDPTTDLSSWGGVNAIIQVPGTNTADTSLISGITVASADKIGFEAANSQFVIISSDSQITGKDAALKLDGAGSGVYNRGILNNNFDTTGPASTAIVFSGSGTSSITNFSSIFGSK